MKSSKYKLRAATEDGKLTSCAFYGSQEGCRNGNQCQFLHEKVPSSSPVNNSVINGCSSSVVSSESEGDEKHDTNLPDAIPVNSKTEMRSTESLLKRWEPPNGVSGKRWENPPNETSTEKLKVSKHSKTKQVSEEKLHTQKRFRSEGDIFCHRKEDPITSQPTKKKKSHEQQKFPKIKLELKNEITENSLFALKSSSRSKSLKSKSINGLGTILTKKQNTSITSFRDLHLPIAAFSIPYETVTKKCEMNENRKKEIKSMKTSQEVHLKKDSLLHLPTSTEIGRSWKDIVIKTYEHERYKSQYDFEKAKKQSEEKSIGGATDWIKARPYGEWCKDNPQVIAIDCEMCETKDPLTGSVNPKALCRISVVNAETEETLIDSLVKPEWPVTNYRTWVNGINKGGLENVEFTLRHAQAFMMALCSEETVIIGQALFNDLFAIRMEHHCNVDSAHLFVTKDDPFGSPSLKDIASTVLDQAMPEIHDSVNDALMTLRVVQYYIKNGGVVKLIIRSSIRNKLAGLQLFCHRIPKICKSNHLETLFLKHSWIKPNEIDEINFSGEYGNTLISFATIQHANLAFMTLEGEEELDKSGRSQKKVYLRDGGYIRVRKMFHDRK